MDVLVDANILLRLAQPGDPQHAIAKGATTKLLLSGAQLHLVPQNIYEFWSVATRPVVNNGLGFPAGQIQCELAKLKKLFVLRDDVPPIYPEWEQLVTRHAVVGKQVHDTRLVAAMIVHNITHLLTFNQQDFLRYTNITIVTPAEVRASP